MVVSPYSPRDSQGSSPTPQFKSISSLALSFLYSSTLTSIHDYWKTIALTRWTFIGKVMSLLFDMLSRLVIALQNFVSKVMFLLFNTPSWLVIAFLPRSKCLLISWLQSLSTVIFEAPQNEICHCLHCLPIYLP